MCFRTKLTDINITVLHIMLSGVYTQSFLYRVWFLSKFLRKRGKASPSNDSPSDKTSKLKISKADLTKQQVVHFHCTLTMFLKWAVIYITGTHTSSVAIWRLNYTTTATVYQTWVCLTWLFFIKLMMPSYPLPLTVTLPSYSPHPYHMPNQSSRVNRTPTIRISRATRATDWNTSLDREITNPKELRNLDEFLGNQVRRSRRCAAN